MLHFFHDFGTLDWVTVQDLGSSLGLFAQAFEDNLGGTVSSAFENFLESGQAWALGIGFILGYIVRSLTAY